MRLPPLRRRRWIGCGGRCAGTLQLLPLLLASLLSMSVDGQSVATSPPERLELETCFPVGVRRGDVARLTLAGKGIGASVVARTGFGTRAGVVEATAGATPAPQQPVPATVAFDVPTDTVPGFHDVWIEGPGGVTRPRTLVVSDVPEMLEAESPASAGKASVADAMSVPLDVAVNGRMDAAGDRDHFRFHARQGQLVVLECLADRIDSPLRATLELYDASGKRLAVNRGFHGIDPLLAFEVPETADYVVRVQDLILAGGPDYIYRLEIDTRPRVAFCDPSVVREGEAARVTLYGWNLSADLLADAAADKSAVAADPWRPDAGWGPNERTLERRTVMLDEGQTRGSGFGGVRFDARQLEWRGFAWHLPGSVRAIPLATTDVPVLQRDSHASRAATNEPMEVLAPCEVAGQLQGSSIDWYALTARRGEVFYFEAWGQRLAAPVDLQMGICRDDARRTQVHAFPPREVPVPTRDVAPTDFALQTTDPAGRWVAPDEGRYLVYVRDAAEGVDRDPRRVYRWSVRREEPESTAVVVTRRDESSALVLAAGGRELLDVWAVRRRGSTEPLRIRATELPAGIECPDVWIPSGATHGTLVVSASPDAAIHAAEGSANHVASGTLRLQMETAEGREASIVRSGTRVRPGRPEGWGRITSQLQLAVRGREAYRLVATHDPAVDHHLYGALRIAASQGSVLDLFVHLERDASASPAAVRLVGEGLPDSVRSESTLLPAGSPGAFVSFYLPPSLPAGSYSWIVRGEMEQRLPDGKVEQRTLFSNPVTVEVAPAAFHVSTDPLAVTRARRGDTILVRYQSQRLPGFIGKMHTELAVAGKVTDVPGLLSRGETFVGQSEQGSIQIIVQDDAPLGRVPALRLFTVGVVEDEPRYFGSSLVNLEIVE